MMGIRQGIDRLISRAVLVAKQHGQAEVLLGVVEVEHAVYLANSTSITGKRKPLTGI